MFHTKQLDNQINDLHERAFRLTYQNRISSFDELLKIDKSVSIHYRHFQYFSIKVYKDKVGMFPSIMDNIILLD